MGLDMYLEATKSFSNYEHDSEEQKKETKKLFDFLGIPEKKRANYKWINQSVQVGYWRKANQIHKWFVDTCQDGIDQCQRVFVSKEELKSLLTTCEIVLADHSKAESELPVSSGFFFGSDQYDEGYFEDLKYTVELLKDLLEDPFWENYDFHYQSSW